MKPLIRIIYKFGYPLARFYWFFRRPRTTGVRCIITQGDHVLLIRHTYGNRHWSVPGGGIKRHESPHDAVIREVLEEVGITLSSATPIESVYSTSEWKRDTTHIFTATTDTSAVTIDETEIQEACWFPIEALPEHTAPLLCRFFPTTPHHEAIPN